MIRLSKCLPELILFILITVQMQHIFSLTPKRDILSWVERVWTEPDQMIQWLWNLFVFDHGYSSQYVHSLEFFWTNFLSSSGPILLKPAAITVAKRGFSRNQRHQSSICPSLLPKKIKLLVADNKSPLLFSLYSVFFSLVFSEFGFLLI